MSKLNSHVKKENNGAAVTTEEAAQYEVFKNGSLGKETIDKWIRNDLAACYSFIGGCLSDESIFRALADAFYARYEKLHEPKHPDDLTIKEKAL